VSPVRALTLTSRGVLVRKYLAPPRRGGANYHWHRHPPGLRGPRFLRSSRWFFGNLFGGFLGRAPYCAARISRGVTFRVPRGRSFGRREYRPFRRAKQSLTLPWRPGHPFKGRKAIEYTPAPRHVAGRASARYSPRIQRLFLFYLDRKYTAEGSSSLRIERQRRVWSSPRRSRRRPSCSF